jgi:L,D-transpeptidase catalytic domain
MSRRALPALVILAVVLSASPVSARPGHQRAAAVSVSLEAAAAEVPAGDSVRLSGAIDPPSGGETVEIRDGDGNLVASPTTGAAGRFHADVTPAATTAYHAEWSGLESPEVTVGVRASIGGLRLTNVRPFDTARASGNVTPSRPGDEVTVLLVHKGRVVATRRPVMGSGGGFAATFPIKDIGTFRVRARYDADDLLRAAATTKPRTTPTPRLHEASRSTFVTLLERRLRALHYHLTGEDRHFDARTSDAIMAFRKVQRMPRNHTVSDALWRALAHPRRISPRSGADGLHIEIDQRRQVLYTVVDGAVSAIIHTSTGKPSTPTYDGTFTVARKIAGFSPHQLYYPSYFDGNRAIHGWPDVPSYAASHGCSRVPYWTAKWIFGLATIGTRVIVYHS